MHEADLPIANDTSLLVWGVVDDWQLIMWLLAVGAFYYQMRISLSLASEAEREQSQRNRDVMLLHVDFGKQLVALPQVSEELRLEAVKRLKSSLEGMSARLRGIQPNGKTASFAE